MSNVELSHIVPILPTPDIEQTLHFYVHILGFENDWNWENNTMIRVKRGSITLIFEKNENPTTKIKGMDFMLFLSGIDNFYNEVRDKVKLTDDLEDKPWGLREFAIQDNNGIFLRFAESIQMLASK